MGDDPIFKPQAAPVNFDRVASLVPGHLIGVWENERAWTVDRRCAGQKPPATVACRFVRIRC